MKTGISVGGGDTLTIIMPRYNDAARGPGPLECPISAERFQGGAAELCSLLRSIPNNSINRARHSK